MSGWKLNSLTSAQKCPKVLFNSNFQKSLTQKCKKKKETFAINSSKTIFFIMYIITKKALDNSCSQCSLILLKYLWATQQKQFVWKYLSIFFVQECFFFHPLHSVLRCLSQLLIQQQEHLRQTNVRYGIHPYSTVFC